MKRPKGSCGCYLNDLPPEEAKALILRTLYRNGGISAKSAEALDVARQVFFDCLTKYGMKEEPKRIRQELLRRFRLPPR